MPAEPYKFDGGLSDWKKSQIIPFCKGSVLDIGCNTGALVGYLNSIGIHAEGIDSNAEFISQARSRYPGCTFYVGEDFSIFQHNQFETVVAWNLLEHIKDDVAALREMIRIAKACVVLSIPKEDDLSLPISRITYRPYVDPTHYHYYTVDSFKALVDSIGKYKLHINQCSRVFPLFAYNKIGIPFWICSLLDKIFWKLSSNKSAFFSNIITVIETV